jgi:uncharacterized protein with NRDE domain
MCLIAFAHNVHPDYKLILVANRDEFYGRPTRQAQFWIEEDHPEILAGKDLEAGGTWMGINKDGRWGALTNYRDPSWKREDPPSRGHLVLNYLSGNDSPQVYTGNLESSSDAYMGFNLLAGNGDQLFHYSNKSDVVTEVKPGIHGVSNALLDTAWPKLDTAKKDLEAIISSGDFKIEDLFGMLYNTETAPESKLPDTGIPKEWENAVSSIFIKTENYGTRCSTLLLIDNTDKVTFAERRYKTSDHSVIDTKHFNF